MLKIIIEDKYLIELPKKIELNIVEENPLFSDDKIPLPYSLSFEIDATRNNLEAFGVPNRVTSLKTKKKVQAKIYSNEIRYSIGEIILLGFDKKIKLQYKGSVESSEMQVSLNKIFIGEYDFGTFPSYPPFEPQVYNQAYYNNPWATQFLNFVNNQAINPTEFVLGPVRISDKQWEGHYGRNGGINAIKMYINYFTPTYTNNYFLIGRYHANPNQPNDRKHAPILPFPYVRNIINAAFGDTLQENPFTEGDLAKLCIVAENHPNYIFDMLYSTYPNGFLPTHPLVETFNPLVDSYERIPGTLNTAEFKFKLQSFMQSYHFNSFLIDLLKIFGMSLYKDDKFKIIRDDDIFTQTPVINLDDYLLEDEIIYDNEEAKNYVFEYSGAQNSEDAFAKISKISTATDELLNPAVPASEKEYQDVSTNQVIKLIKKLVGLSNWKWLTQETKRSALIQKGTENIENKYTVTSNVTPLEMSVEQYWEWDNSDADEMARYHWYVPLIQREDVTAAPHIMLAYGMSHTVEHNDRHYPLITNHNVDMFGQRRGDISLLPNGTDGIIAKFHSRKKKWIETPKITVKGSFAIPELVNRNLKIYHKVHLKGKDFLIKTREYSLTHDGISPVELELVECVL